MLISLFSSKFVQAARQAALACLLAAALPATAQQSVSSQVAQAARQFLGEQAARAGWLNPQIETSVLPGNSRAALACRQPLRVVPVDTRQPSRMRFAASCPGTDAEPREFVVHAEISAEVLVTTVALPANRAIAAADLALERHDVVATPDALSDLTAVVGQSSRRSLRAGQVVLRQMLVMPVLVKRGEAVRIVARSGPVEVTSTGEALEAGRGEDTVRVRNVATGKVIRARVTASGTVEPIDLPQSMPPQSPD